MDLKALPKGYDSKIALFATTACGWRENHLASYGGHGQVVNEFRRLPLLYDGFMRQRTSDVSW